MTPSESQRLCMKTISRAAGPEKMGQGEREEKMVKVSNEKEEERGEKRRREEEKEENETETVKRRCEDFGSVEAFEIFGHGGDLESGGDLSREDLWDKDRDQCDRKPETRVDVPEVLDVTDVPVPLLLWSLSFVIVSLVARVGISWNRSPFLSPKKRVHSCTATQKEMWSEEQQVNSDVEKKNDAVHTNGKFVRIIRRRARACRSGRPDVECERQSGHWKYEAVPGKQ